LSEDFQSSFGNANHPAVNITEKDKSYDITLMAPGLTKTDFKIGLENNLLTISYEKGEDKTESTEKFIKKEFSIKSFKRSFTLNENLNSDEITASYENGLLTVNVPKVEEKEKEANVKTININ